MVGSVFSALADVGIVRHQHAVNGRQVATTVLVLATVRIGLVTVRGEIVAFIVLLGYLKENDGGWTYSTGTVPKIMI